MLTLGQLIKLGENVDIDIFSGLSLPVNNPLDRDILINSIIEKCGMNYPVYADPVTMESAITLWSAKNQYTFDHVGKIFSAVYSPIENKDYYEDTETGRERDLTDNTTGRINKSENTTGTVDKTTSHSGTDTTTDEDETSAYNANDYQPKNKSTSDIVHGENIRDAGSTTLSKTSNSGTASDKTIDENENITVSTHQHGNIGVSTFFDIQRGEYELMAEYNPYTFLAGLFENELTLFIY